jgi:hypothetical protein
VAAGAAAGTRRALALLLLLLLLSLLRVAAAGCCCCCEQRLQVGLVALEQRLLKVTQRLHLLAHTRLACGATVGER